jgi:8-oxo-dGTP pyrophosphatase MutT (NUDIX family)
MAAAGQHDDTRAKVPAILYHGSPRKDLTSLCPSEHRALHASDDIRLALTFLARPGRCCCMKIGGKVIAWIGEDKESFRRRDRGGSVYLVDGRAFAPKMESLHRFWEYTTNEVVWPLGRLDYPSAYAALVTHELRVIFMTAKEYERVDATNGWYRAIASTCGQSRGEIFATGVLPICTNSGRICLAWRSPLVTVGSCWGTIGGAATIALSLRHNAVRELQEETGYCDEIELHPAYVFREHEFEYHNFIGLVPQEFSLKAEAANRWETDELCWCPLNEWRSRMRSEPRSFHPGVRELFRLASPMIESYCRLL